MEQQQYYNGKHSQPPYYGTDPQQSDQQPPYYEANSQQPNQPPYYGGNPQQPYQPPYNGGNPQQSQVFVVTNPAQPQPSTQAIIIVQQSPKQGKFDSYYSSSLAKVCGVSLDIAGIIVITGAILESIGLNGSSTTEYCGYWCGPMIILGGGFASRSAYQKTGCMITTTLFAILVGAGFAGAVIGLSAVYLDFFISLIDLCSSCSKVWILLSSYSCLVGGAALALLFITILAISAVITLARGLCCPKRATQPADIPMAVY